MATPPPRVSDNPEVQQDYLVQLALSVALVQALAGVFPSFDPHFPRQTFPDVRRGAAAVIGELSSAAISMSADHFEAMREQAGIVKPFTVPIINPPSVVDIETQLDKVAADLLTSQSSDFEALRQAIENEIEAAAQKMLADAASDEQLAAIEADPVAIGWARVTRPGACAFCTMLATRGPVYASKKTASFRPHERCHCTVEPLWRGAYEPPAHIREAQAIWKKSTDGRSGKDALRTFRRALEGGNLRERPAPIPAAPAVSQRDQFASLLAGLVQAGAVSTSR